MGKQENNYLSHEDESIVNIADSVAGSKYSFVTDPTLFLLSGGIPCCPFPSRWISKWSSMSRCIWVLSSSPTLPATLVDDEMDVDMTDPSSI